MKATCFLFSCHQQLQATATNFLLKSSTLPLFLTCKNLFVGFTLAFNYLFRWPLWYRVLSPSRNHIIVLYAYKNDMSTQFTLNPQLSISHSQLSRTPLLYSVFVLTSPAKEEYSLLTILFIFITRVSLFPWLG